MQQVYDKLREIMVGGCTCMTKTPDTKYHSERCHYRLAREAFDLLWAINNPQQQPCTHPKAKCVYESEDGEFERWECPDCYERWGREIPQ